MKNVTLYFREGSSDKVYKASIDQSGANYLVNFAYGRRGSTLTTGTKTPNAVPLIQAEKIFHKLVLEKKGKGYVEDVNAVPFSSKEFTATNTGIIPQLLNEIPEEDLEKYINDDNWCSMEKYDGQRRILAHLPGRLELTGINRRGLSIQLTKELENDFSKSMDGEKIFDGEAMGDAIILFDTIIKDMTFKDRYNWLKSNIQLGKYLKLGTVAWTTDEKRKMLESLRKDNAEGIVFKRVDSFYTPGRPNSGGDQLKFKFVTTASCIVITVNTSKRSVQLAVLDQEGMFINVGNVTVYPNQEIPQAGDIVEVKYLYYYPKGSLYQPVLIGKREDILKEECTLEQLKEKRESE